MAVLSGLCFILFFLCNYIPQLSSGCRGMTPWECCSPSSVGYQLLSRCSKDSQPTNPKGYNELRFKSLYNQYLKDRITLFMDF